MTGCWNKSSPEIPKVAQKIATAVFTFLKTGVIKQAQKVNKYCATSVSKFDAKNFQKSPNLVTLLPTRHCLSMADCVEWQL